MNGLFGEPKKILFNLKLFLNGLFFPIIGGAIFGYYTPIFFDVAHGKLYRIIVAEILIFIYILLNNIYWFSFFYKKGIVIILTLAYILLVSSVQNQ